MPAQKVRYTIKPAKVAYVDDFAPGGNCTELRSHGCHRATEPLSHEALSATELTSYTSHTANNATDATHDSALSASVGTLQDAARIALLKGIDENCCWTYARAVKAFEEQNYPLQDHSELLGAFMVWWQQAKSMLPKDADIEEFQDDFLQCYRRAKTPLGQNSLENAGTAKVRHEDELLFGPKKAKLMAICRELQRLSEDRPFYLGVRDAARILNARSLYTARNALNALCMAGVLKVDAKGTQAGKKATRYFFIEPPKHKVLEQE